MSDGRISFQFRDGTLLSDLLEDTVDDPCTETILYLLEKAFSRKSCITVRALYDFEYKFKKDAYTFLSRIPLMYWDEIFGEGYVLVDGHFDWILKNLNGSKYQEFIENECSKIKSLDSVSKLINHTIGGRKILRDYLRDVSLCMSRPLRNQPEFKNTEEKTRKTKK
jgi:hypothetical protein